MTRSTKVALTGFLGVVGLSFVFTQGCGQAFKINQKPGSEVLLSIEPPALVSTPPPVSPLQIEQVALHAGKIRLARADSTDFNIFSSSSDISVQQSVNQLFQRLFVYSPGFDSKISWYDRGWAYTSLYGIPVSEANATNDLFILRDQSGNRLFLEPNVYAANILDTNYRNYWIERARALVGKGYRGLFIDDVNLSLVTINAAGSSTAAFQNGIQISLVDWQNAVGLFTENIRSAFPLIEIVHNSIWSADVAGNFMSDFQTRVINSAQLQFIESGIHQVGLTGGTLGTMTIQQQKKFIDRVHSLNRSIVLGGVPAGASEKEYAAAYYYLFSNATDYLSDNGIAPGAQFAGYGLDLGTPLAPAIRDGSVWSRQFAKGYVILNEPGGFLQNVTTMGYKDIRGITNSFSLPARTGLILIPAQ